MGEGRKLKTEHAGAKNGGGFWGKRTDAKDFSNHRRRQNDRVEIHKFWLGEDGSMQSSLKVKQKTDGSTSNR